MRNVINFKLLAAAALIVTAYSCKRSSNSSNVDSATGWAINDKQGGFQYNTQFKEQETPPGTVFIEGGTFTMGKVQDDPMHDWNNTPTQQHVQSYYMDESEVTNVNYLMYLDYLKTVYPPSDPNYANIYKGALPDTLVWRNRLGYTEMMVNNYLRNPAFGNYPVVGVSWIQAVEYASWRSDRVAEMSLQKAGYLERDSQYTAEAGSTFSTDTYINAPTKTYGGNDSIINPVKSRKRVQVNLKGDTINVYAKRESGLIGPKYRLPTEVEWEYAALGMSELRSYNIYRGRKKYPWDGQYTRSGSRAQRGDQLANFKQSKGDYGGIAGWSDDGADITNEVMSYEPNDFGLYDMAGNVSEWVADVYRPVVDDEFSDFGYFRGNVYTKNAIGSDGTLKVIGVDDIQYDTLSSGRIIAKALPGQLVKVEVDSTDMLNKQRTNFDKSNNINFRDGDRASSRNFDDFNDRSEDSTNEDETQDMYNSPTYKTDGMLAFDDSNDRTSLVNDEVRVYKGGSWKDREYWLDPAQRRYYPQQMATLDIGFRCAMSRVGSKSLSKKKRKN